MEWDYLISITHPYWNHCITGLLCVKSGASLLFLHMTADALLPIVCYSFAYNNRIPWSLKLEICSGLKFVYHAGADFLFFFPSFLTALIGKLLLYSLLVCCVDASKHDVVLQQPIWAPLSAKVQWYKVMSSKCTSWVELQQMSNVVRFPLWSHHVCYCHSVLLGESLWW